MFDATQYRIVIEPCLIDAETGRIELGEARIIRRELSADMPAQKAVDGDAGH